MKSNIIAAFTKKVFGKFSELQLVEPPAGAFKGIPVMTEMSEADKITIEEYADAMEPTALQKQLAIQAYHHNLGPLKPRQGEHMEFMSEITSSAPDIREQIRTRAAVIRYKSIHRK